VIASAARRRTATRFGQPRKDFDMAGLFNDADTITLSTPAGAAVAVRARSGEWRVAYPAGDDRHVGTRDEVETVMRQRIAADYPDFRDAEGR
jgi:hypothetical protein